MNFRNPLAAAGAVACLLLSLSSCSKASRTASFGTPENVLSFGVYTAATLDSGLSVKLSLNQSGTYSKKKFQGSCFVSESKGEWSSDNEAMEFHLMEIRTRPDCNTEDWQTQKADKRSRRHIRSVTTNSFELLDQDDRSSDEWVKFVKR
jgi:hypothetical protein